MKFTLRLISVILCLVMLLGCITIQAADKLDKIKTDYLSYVDSHYPLYSVDINDIFIRGSYGNHNGYDIVFMGIKNRLVSPMVSTVDIAGIKFTFPNMGDSDFFYAYKDGNFIPVNYAYDAGLLDKTDIYNIAVATGDIVLPEYKELWSDGNITLTIEETTSTLYLSGDGRTEDYELFMIGGLDIPMNISPIYGNLGIKHVVIDEGITYIGRFFFDGCENIETVTLPDSLEEIGDHCFYNCTKISHVIFPEGIKRIGNFCFENENLNTLTFCGNLPKMKENSVLKYFKGTVYYPKSNPTWTDEAMMKYSSAITWESWIAPNIKNVYNRFTDVSKNGWYTDAVQFTFDTGMMTGMNKTIFSPNTTLTRAQVVQVLFNLSGEDANDYADRTYFDDVSKYAWYAPVITWAYENHITYGVESNRFAPNQPVKRGELVTFLLNYALELGCTPSTESVDLKSYEDHREVDNWCYTGMAWAVHEGIVTGMTETTLAPRANANRAQAARMLMKYYEYLNDNIPVLTEVEQAIADYVVENGKRHGYFPNAYEYVVKENGKWYIIEYFTYGAIEFSYYTSPDARHSFGSNNNFNEGLTVYTDGLSDEYEYYYFNSTNNYRINSQGIFTSNGFEEKDFNNNYRTLSDEEAKSLRDTAMSELDAFINKVLGECGFTMNDLLAK